MKKLLAIFLALLMVVSVFAACDNTANNDPASTTPDNGDNVEGDDNEDEAEREVVEFAPDAEYVYKDAVGVMATRSACACQPGSR